MYDGDLWAATMGFNASSLVTHLDPSIGCSDWPAMASRQRKAKGDLVCEAMAS